MLVSYNWLKDYVDFDMDPEELAHKLTMAGLEVDSINTLDHSLEGVVVGYVEKREPHPNSDHLSVCQVDVGRGEPLTIVCGAPNVAAGQKVPVALEGTELPGGVVIKKAVIRKVESSGMICSGNELGLDSALLSKEEQEGIMVLPQDSVVGASITETLGLNDIVFEIDLTPNRADCMGIRNVAREVAAIAGVPLKPLNVEFEENPEITAADMIKVEIKDPDLCGRYVARAVTDVKVGPSPAWLQNRLKAVGVRPISNIVDVTNFVMMELNQPLHAFDYNFLEDKTIVVRRAEPEEVIVTLDGQERKLDPETLVIADGKRPVAIAGVMGGENSEIMEDTTTVLIESANFNMVNIRRTSKRLGLRSESSIRFEKGVNIDGALEAANRAAQLMAQLGGGRVVTGAVDNYPGKQDLRKINISLEKVNMLLGLDLSEDDIIELLEPIDLICKKSEPGYLVVTVPPFRLDMERDVDVVEEVARRYGYERIPLTIPQGDVGQIKLTWEQRLERKCNEILIGCGLKEVVSYSFMNPHSFDKWGLPQGDPLRNTVVISNPLSEEHSVMRTSMIPNLLEIAQRNASRKNLNLGIFEFGRIFSPVDNQDPVERPMLAGLVMGSLQGGWNWPKEEMDFFFLKGVVEKLLNSIGITDVKWVSATGSGMHPGRTARIVGPDNETIGILGEVHPDAVANFELSSRACVFELEFQVLASLASGDIKYSPLHRFPSAERDLAVIVAEEVAAAELEDVILKTGGELLAHCHLFDIYRGKQVPENKKSMAYSLVYRAPDRTLTDEEINSRHQMVKEELVKLFGAELR